MADRTIEVEHSEPKREQESPGEGRAAICASAHGAARRTQALKTTLAGRSREIADGWLEKAARAYPPEAAKLFSRGDDPFGNPVGHGLTTGIRGVLDGLLADAEVDELVARLEPILKVRSVQSLPPSGALAFVLGLKDVIREKLGDELRGPRLAGEWDELQARIDQLALLAFDVFARWREAAHEVRIREIRREMSEHLRGLNLTRDDGAANARSRGMR